MIVPGVFHHNHFLTSNGEGVVQYEQCMVAVSLWTLFYGIVSNAFASVYIHVTAFMNSL